MAERDYAIVTFWSDEDDCCIADIPNLQYFSAFGDTPEAALAEVRVAMQGWLETVREDGMPLPEPLFRKQLPLPISRR